MYAAAVPVSGARTGGLAAIPLAAICCLGLLAFLVAATIVLALIPLYLPNKSSGTATASTSATTASTTATVTTTVASATTTTTVVSTTTAVSSATTTVAGATTTAVSGGATTTTTTASSATTRSAVMQGTVAATNAAASAPGTGTNNAAVGSALGLSSGGSNAATVTGLQTQPGSSRRKRGVLNRRRRQTLILKVLLNITLSNCSDSTCTNASNSVNTTLQSFSGSVTIVVTINGQSVTISNIALTFVSFSTTAATGFGTNPSGNFTASRSGNFSDPTAWVGGISPYGSCSVFIPSGITISIPGSSLSTNVTFCQISGTLIVNSNNNAASFVFNNPIIIIVNPSGTFQDGTTGKQISFQAPSVYHAISGSNSPNGSTVTGLTSGRTLGQPVQFQPTSKGCSVVCGQKDTRSFPRTTPYCENSGDGTTSAPWIGGIAPSNTLCPNNCGVAISGGAVVSTVAIFATIQIERLDVAVGSTCSFGATTTTVFTFLVIIDIEILGTIGYSGTGQIQIPGGSDFNLNSGAFFQASVSISLAIIVSGAIVGNPLLLLANQAGPYFLETTITGTYIFSTTAAGQNNSVPTSANSSSSSTTTRSSGSTTTAPSGSTTSGSASGSTTSGSSSGSTTSGSASGSTTSGSSSGSTTSGSASGSTTTTRSGATTTTRSGATTTASGGTTTSGSSGGSTTSSSPPGGSTTSSSPPGGSTTSSSPPGGSTTSSSPPGATTTAAGATTTPMFG